MSTARTGSGAARATGGTVRLPGPDGTLVDYRPAEPGAWRRPEAPLRARRAFAAAHVVPDLLADNTPGAPAALDWEATLGFRRELWSWGLGVADAMDTAQRGMGLDWAATRELIARSGAEAAALLADPPAALAGRTVPEVLACGAGTDQLDLAEVTALPAERALAAVLEAYREQVQVVDEAGATVILMASRALARVARGPEDYEHVYGTLLAEVDRPVILHWLGEMFDPALAGYWGSAEVPAATETFLGLLHAHATKVDGVKVSLLDADHERALRARLPEGVRLYTGDDFNYPELIHGDGQHHSDALLGIFAAIYPAAGTALAAYDAGEGQRGRDLLATTQQLGRHVFSAPTLYYKTGVALLAWLNGHQPGFQMVGGLHAGRSVPHQVRTFTLAGDAGLLTDPELACHRMARLLEVAGVSR
ncbi:dihydrodipicolinate synthase family protein [Ornithinicoccus halotolerans]|uniref:dihydrodipicolinate synthase family protein n=1 Tax=Ornithinicoccus halotolerans TaxID=1748220 RepID=UPI0012954FF5|nr:dihydrodipicolinate synthase family protein [Ornithinicoccus halotolerans]